uniref:Large ribosomal subunit protein bL34m n=1 Tax=Catagonus wagneri TaxID=51154 RepID=A0A8C3WIW9_9CETA
MAFLAGSPVGSRQQVSGASRWQVASAPGLPGAPRSMGSPRHKQIRGKACGNEYQPSNIKHKHRHGWVLSLSTPTGVQIILRCTHRG